VLQCVAVCCSVLQCVAVCCSVLQASYYSSLSRSHNLSGNTGGNKTKKRGGHGQCWAGKTHWQSSTVNKVVQNNVNTTEFMRTKYLFAAYIVFKTVMDKNASDRLM